MGSERGRGSSRTHRTAPLLQCARPAGGARAPRFSARASLGAVLLSSKPPPLGAVSGQSASGRRRPARRVPEWAATARRGSSAAAASSASRGGTRSRAGPSPTLTLREPHSWCVARRLGACKRELKEQEQGSTARDGKTDDGDDGKPRGGRWGSNRGAPEQQQLLHSLSLSPSHTQLVCSIRGQAEASAEQSEIRVE